MRSLKKNSSTLPMQPVFLFIGTMLHSGSAMATGEEGCALPFVESYFARWQQAISLCRRYFIRMI